MVGPKKGTIVTCMAKVKEHGERDGIKQTMIQRPTKVHNQWQRLDLTKQRRSSDRLFLFN